MTATACLKKRRRPKLHVDGSLFRRPASFEPLRGQRRDRYVTLCTFACSKARLRPLGRVQKLSLMGAGSLSSGCWSMGKFCTGALRFEALIRNKSVAPSLEGMGRPQVAQRYVAADAISEAPCTLGPAASF